MDGQRVERKWGERREVLRRTGFLACAVEVGNARGSGVWGEELELNFELIECDTYQRILEQVCLES